MSVSEADVEQTSVATEVPPEAEVESIAEPDAAAAVAEVPAVAEVAAAPAVEVETTTVVVHQAGAEAKVVAEPKVVDAAEPEVSVAAIADIAGAAAPAVAAAPAPEEVTTVDAAPAVEPEPEVAAAPVAEVVPPAAVEQVPEPEVAPEAAPAPVAEEPEAGSSQFELPSHADIRVAAQVHDQCRAALDATGDVGIGCSAVERVDAAVLQCLCSLAISLRENSRQLEFFDRTEPFDRAVAVLGFGELLGSD